MNTPVYAQTDFRGKYDTGDESSTDWIDVAHANWSQAVDTKFRVRFAVDETTGNGDAENNQSIVFEYNHNTTGWTAITTGSTYIQAVASDQAGFVDGNDCTQQISAGNFNTPNAGQDEDGTAGGANWDPLGNGYATEFEICLTIPSGAVADGDTIGIRCTKTTGAAISTYTYNCELTVDKSVTTTGAGSASLTFGGTASIEGTGSMAGSAAVAFTGAASGKATGQMAGSSALTIGGTASIHGVGVLKGGGGNDLLTSLVSHYDLDETSGTRADSHGDGDLTDGSGTVGYRTGKLGNAADFDDAEGDWLWDQDTNGLGWNTTAQDFTICLWIYADADADYDTFVSYGSNNSDWTLRMRYFSSALEGIVQGTATSTTISTSMSTGAWHFVALRHDAAADQVDLRVDTTDATPVSYAGGNRTGGSSYTFFLGGFHLTGSTAQSFMDGALDEVAIWNRVLQDSELSAVWNSGTPLPYSSYGSGGGGDAGVTFGGSASIIDSSAGALRGSAALTFGGTAAITATYEGAGSAAVVFAAQASITGRYAGAGSAAVVFTAQASGTATAQIAGSAAVTFGGSAVAQGTGSMAGSAAVTFGGTSALSGTGGVAGSAAVTFGGSATIQDAAGGAMAGSATVIFGGSASAQGTGSMAGSSALSLGASASLEGRYSASGAAAIVFGGTATIGGKTSLQGQAAFVIDGQGNLTGTGELAGQADVVFGGQGSLAAGAMKGSAALVIDGQGTLSGTGSMAGSSDLVLIGSGSIHGRFAAAGQAAVVFDGQGAMATGAIRGSAAVVFDGSASIEASLAAQGVATLTIGGTATIQNGSARRRRIRVAF